LDRKKNLCGVQASGEGVRGAEQLSGCSGHSRLWVDMHDTPGEGQLLGLQVIGQPLLDLHDDVALQQAEIDKSHRLQDTSTYM
jgi:hypothetical protein